MTYYSREVSRLSAASQEVQVSPVAELPGAASTSGRRPASLEAGGRAERLEPLAFHPDYYDASGRLMLKNLTLQELEAWCISIGEDRRRALHVWRWMYYDGYWLADLDDAPATTVQNGFSAAFRDKVRPLATLCGGLRLQSVHAAADGTRKLALTLTAGPGAGGRVEAVLIPIVRSSGGRSRITLCVSSQVGCAMNCQFCLTGRMGLRGSLTAAQVVEQVVIARRFLRDEDLAAGAASHISPLTNVVYMGMGEPMHNLPAVLPSLDILVQPLGLHLSRNKVTVSTVGLVPEMRQVAASGAAVLAVSLHATTDEVRDWIVPVNRRYNLRVRDGTERVQVQRR